MLFIGIDDEVNYLPLSSPSKKGGKGIRLKDQTNPAIFRVGLMTKLEIDFP